MDSQQDVPAQEGQAGGERPRDVSGAATAVTVLVSLELVRETLVTVQNWRVYFIVHDYLAGNATAEDLLATDSDTLAKLGSTWILALIVVAVGIAWLVWLWRARINSELMGGAAAHRRARGWTVGSWVAPVANLWIPYQVVRDVWRASAPRRPVSVTLIGAWWALFVAANAIVKPIQWHESQTMDSEQEVLTNANLSTLLTALYTVAGLLMFLIVWRVTAWQTSERAGKAV